jgi:proline dehydrogenase
VLRRVLVSAADNAEIKRLISTAPGSRNVVRRFVAGETVEDAVGVARRLIHDGLSVSLDHLGEHTTDVRGAQAQAQAYCVLLGRLADEGLAAHAEVSVKLSALGIGLDRQLAVTNAATICAAASAAGTAVTIDMEDAGTTDATLAVLAELRVRYPATAAVIQSYLRRSAADCHTLATPGSRVRLCKGAYREPAEVAYQGMGDVRRSYLRCLRILMGGPGYPMVATHDPILIGIAGMLARRAGRKPTDYEHQMLYGVRPGEQRRLAEEGRHVRVYVPYGAEWYAYLMRRLAERPANVVFFLHALGSRS